MIRKMCGLALAFTLLLSSHAYAGPPKFSGGSSSSSGPRISSGPKFSGGSSSSGPKLGTSTPSVSPPKFSGGSNTSSVPKVGTASPSVSPPKFSGGSTTSGVPKGSATDKPVFGGGSTSPPAKTVTTTPIQGRQPTSVSKKPAAETFDKLSGTEARKTESRKAYEKSEAPATSYKTPTGKEVPIAKNDKSADYLRGRLDESRWQNRQQRTDGFYGSYYSRYPSTVVVHYGDYYHPYWNYWLLGQTVDVMSLWVYHHQMSMDTTRLNYLYSQNAELRARVAALERQGIPRDVTYTPRGVDADFMYDDGYVNACWNPRPKQVDYYEYDNPPPSSSGGAGVGKALLWIFVYIPLIIVGLVVLYWLVFHYRW